MDKKYRLINKSLTKKGIRKRYGNVSFAYTKKQENRYEAVAISLLEPQYLKTELLIDKVSFFGVDSVLEPKYFFGIY